MSARAGAVVLRPGECGQQPRRVQRSRAGKRARHRGQLVAPQRRPLDDEGGVGAGGGRRRRVETGADGVERAIRQRGIGGRRRLHGAERLEPDVEWTAGITGQRQQQLLERTSRRARDGRSSHGGERRSHRVGVRPFENLPERCHPRRRQLFGRRRRHGPQGD